MVWFTSFATLLWLIAAFWLLCGLTALRGLRRVPNLWNVAPTPTAPTQITVIIPARNEASAIEATLRSLLAQTIPVDVVAVNDRSTDSTGTLLDRIAAEPLPPGKSLRVLHVHELPAGWLGKPHAMAFAARHATTPWLLFTDADVLFAPDVLARALRFAAESQADHMVLMPTLILKSAGERAMATFFQALSLLWWRPWRIANPGTRDSIGIGAFNLIRADVYRAVGGFEAQRFQVLDDVRLGVEVKRNGYRQRIVFGRELIRLHWAPGALGMARNLTKNLFAGFAFNSALLLGACLGLALICYAPIAGLFFSWPLRSAALLSLAMIALHYRLAGRYFSGLSFAWAFTLPVTAVLVLYAMLRSMILTLARRGIVWRGTFYPLADLRRHSGRLR
ncbi:MAG TPA: glycosyltransferase [Acidobacteriaceae bacterium]|jgi:glycosyltransferase involved in cell wall biosynthesis|nr:glycosyltransferase [Acidobacteriaceae bacterium]